jgi:hypothetical protein
VSDPVAIPYAALTAALTDWQVDPGDVLDLSLRATPAGGWLEVVRRRRDADGHPLTAGGGVATITTMIGIDPATTGEELPA